MKKYMLTILLSSILILTLAACGNKPGPEEEPSSEAAVTGGWTLTEQDAVKLPEEVQQAFSKVTQGEKDGLTPVALVAHQVVAGTNDMILCKSGSEYRMIVIYRNLQGNAELTGNQPFLLTDYTRNGGEAVAEQLAGGWYAAEDTAVLPLPEDAKTALEKAKEGFVGSNIEPMALLGTQLVAGTNYAILCRVTPVVPNAVSSVQVVTVYADLQGNAEFISFHPIDPAEFNQ